ncbi:hypothetical protein KJ652_01405 [Patescibacteria group bacterium]|nr:hypothetical protein [Patescibacteria group bacterium]MBU1123226.1 hypothetical protein [Patescibacteria group bacterium]
MDKIEKLLRALTAKEQEAIMLLMDQLKRDYKKVPGISSVKGKRRLFKVRIGKYRIVFEVHSKTNEIEIRKVARRNEKTYKNL